MRILPLARPLLALTLASAALATTLGAEKPHGYLPEGAFDLLQVLPPAPVKGDARYKADRTIFKQTRKMIGTPRYQLATSDVKTDQRSLMADFSCAVGVTLTPENAPRTQALVARARVDTSRQTNIAKDFYKRQRPFLIDHGDICEPKAELMDSYDYPSGHTTLGWTWASVLSDLVPDRATQIMARGRAYGDSRFICGAHNESAVEGGKLSAGATMSVVRTTAAYQADAAAARAELNALRRAPNTEKPTGCEMETALVAQRVQ
ncbi:acid phosphatase [Sphingomonas abietis]|uniref:Acid phosphatase n=1 Tax=Sphingomonas abietis TaxID=3012344 RepID=A0ABY7NIC6_9SPHN|nr:phosphatase PAP2 family protein [Sphingomonas abietis]WBO21093.1 phosphatase PAP2 family protein [Sphingomonas abietis]